MLYWKFGTNLAYADWIILKSEFEEIFFAMFLPYERETPKSIAYQNICSAWSIKFKDISLKRTCEKSVFPDGEIPVKVEEMNPDVEAFKIESFDKLNWSTLGSMIAKLYDYLSDLDNGSALSATFESGDFLLNEVQTEPDQTEMQEETFTDIEMDAEPKSQTDIETEINDVQMDDKEENSNSESTKCAALNTDTGNSADGSTEDSDAQTTGDDGSKTATKPKSRRSGSDLKLLGRWYYWKNRKYSQRQKNKQIERIESDTTINGFLRKTLEKYFE